MELEEALKQLNNPRNPYDRDLIALRVVCLHLLNKQNEPKDEPEPKKKKKVDA